MKNPTIPEEREVGGASRNPSVTSPGTLKENRNATSCALGWGDEDRPLPEVSGSEPFGGAKKL
jgi:hypothetical protein